MKVKSLIMIGALIIVSLIHAEERPNILIYLMDDMGYETCRPYNPEAKTALPQLERLADEGILFTDAHSPSAVYAPTRYRILTGHYPWRGRNEDGTCGFKQTSQILHGQGTQAIVLKNVGYATAIFGNVHLRRTILNKARKPMTEWEYGYKDIDYSKTTKDGPKSTGFEFPYTLANGIQGPPYAYYINDVMVDREEDVVVWEKGDDWNSSQAVDHPLESR